MLIEFRFKNFLSFCDEQVFSMVASKDDSLPNSVVNVKGFSQNRLLLSSVIYGANASGKSNFISAFAFVRKFVLDSADRNIGSIIPAPPFAFSNISSKEPSEFEITFIIEDIRYQYGFSVNGISVINEWLIAYPKGLPQTWYERKKADLNNVEDFEWYFGPNYKGDKKKLIEFTRNDVLFLSIAAKFNHKQLSRVYKWFSRNLRIISPDDMEKYFSQLAAEALSKEDIKTEELIHYFKYFDLGIDGIKINKRKLVEEDFIDGVPEKIKEAILNSESNEKFDIESLHPLLEDENIKVALPFYVESKGTQRLFSLFIPLTLSIDKGYTLIVDELDSSLHPILVRSIIQLFHNSEANKNDGQLIFNTHDTTLLNSGIFGRDQIWFIEKDNDNKSHLYPLMDFSPRKDKNLEIGYLQGRYGSVPFILSNIEGFILNGKKTEK